MTREQVERWLKKNAKGVNIHQSFDSNSVYFEFVDDAENSHILRLSDHELPATYQNREHRHDWDMRYKDSWTEFKTILLKYVSVKKTPKAPQYIPSAEDIEIAKKETLACGSFEKFCNFYMIKGQKKAALQKAVEENEKK